MSVNPTSQPEPSGTSAILEYIRHGAALFLCVFLLSSCGPVLSFLDNDTSKQSQSAQPGNEPPYAAQSGSGQVLSLQGGPPGAALRPLLPGQVGTQYMDNGLPALKPRGVNFETLFADDIEDPMERIRRVENAVIEFRQEFDAVLPAIVRLSAVEKDMQSLIVQLEALTQNEPLPSEAYPVEPAEADTLAAMPSPQDFPGEDVSQAGIEPSVAPVAQAPPPEEVFGQQAPEGEASAQEEPPAATATSPPVALSPTTPSAGKTEEAVSSAIAEPPEHPPDIAAAGANAVMALRIGEHADKTRLVFDVRGAVTYRYDIDNQEKLLIVELPEASWLGEKQWMSDKAPLIASYTVQAMENGKGSRLVVQLKQEASVVYEGTLADDGQDTRRIVIDLRSPAVHP